MPTANSLSDWFDIVSSTCGCTLCEEVKFLYLVNKVDEKVMQSVTTPLIKEELIKAICLGEYPITKEE